jgi:hypothetical protein
VYNSLTIFTCSIYPDVTRIWYHCLQRALMGKNVPVVIYDSGGLLDSRYYPGAKIINYPNEQHGKKVDHFIKYNLETDIFYLTDDDAFLTSGEVLPYGIHWLQADEKNAIVSYKPRLWWSFTINGQEFPTMGSYSLLVKASVIKKHSLSFEIRKTERKEIRKGGGYYDTADFINEYLLQQKYAIDIAPIELRDAVPSFFGTSSAMMSYYHTRWFSKKRKLISREGIEKLMVTDRTALMRALSIVFVSRIYKTLFTESLVYDHFLSLEEIDMLINKRGSDDLQQVFKDTVRNFSQIEKQIQTLS